MPTLASITIPFTWVTAQHHPPQPHSGYAFAMTSAMSTKRTALAAIFTALAVTATGCSEDISEPSIAMTEKQEASEAASETEKSEEVVTETVTAEREKEDGPNRREKCASLPKDPREQYPSGTAPGRMPATDGSDYQYWIDDIENRYDPCAELSYIIFHGSNGDLRGPAETAASINDALAFYINGEPVKDAQPFGKVNSITVDGDTAVIDWSERGDYTAQGWVRHYSANLEVQGGDVRATGGDVAEFNERWTQDLGYMLGHYG